MELVYTLRCKVPLDHRTRQFWLAALLGLVAPIAVVGAMLFPKWREATRRGGQTAAEPFRIAGNFYYVGPATSPRSCSPGRRGTC